MHNFLEILTKPDNIPIAGMAVAIVFVLGVWFRQARRHDKLIRDGKKDQIIEEMRR